MKNFLFFIVILTIIIVFLFVGCKQVIPGTTTIPTVVTTAAITSTTVTDETIAEETETTSTNIMQDQIKVTKPSPNQLIQSPLIVEGEARGSWYFEATFPVELQDADGNVIAASPAQAQGDWMTDNFVPFKVQIEFKKPVTSRGFLVLEKDNPSGLPENSANIAIPVQFE